MGGEARAAVLFVDLENLFPVAESVEKRCDGANIERVRAQPELVAGDAVQLGEDHADILGARRSFDIEQLLDCLAVAQPIRDRGHIIHAVDVRIEHRIGAVFADLFHAAVQVADDAFQAKNFFAVEPQNHAQHAMRGGMLRAHIDDEFIGIQKRLLVSCQIEMRVLGVVSHWLFLFANSTHPAEQSFALGHSVCHHRRH